MNKWVVVPGYQGEDRRSNGANKLIYTIMVSACGVVFLGLSGWMTSMNTHISAVEASTIAKGERLSALEQSVISIDNRLKRIEGKVDVLLERGKQK